MLLLLFNSASSSAVSIGSTIPWNGGNWYLFGADYPWDNYGNDFGANAWGAYGVHSTGTYNQVDTDFANMAAEGIHTTRWWVFSDGRAGITFDSAGMPTGVDQYVYPDLDAAVQIAAKHNIYLNLVLLDFSFMTNAQVTNGVQLGGHANVINTSVGQADLLNNVFIPVFKRYGANTNIISWEVMNEPEWCIQQDAPNGNCGSPSTLANFQSFTQSVASAVHTYTHSYVTVGEADMKWSKQWMGLGLDYYQIHYYDWMHPWATDNLFGTKYSSLGLDAPVVVGEFPAGNSSTANLQTYLDTWYNNGYAGAWPWSYKAVDSNGAPNSATMSTWANGHGNVVNITGPGGNVGWSSLGGYLTSAPASSASSATAVDVFVRGTDNGLWHMSGNGTQFGSWQSMGGVITANPAAVSWGPNRIDVFVRGTDNGLWQQTWNGVSWSNWQSLGGVLTSAPAVSSQGVNSLDVFVRGTDNGLWQKTWNGTSWSNWQSLGGIITADPSSVSSSAGHIDIFVRGTDNGLWQKTWNGSWGNWQSLGGVLNSGAAASSCASGHLDVYVIGTNNGAWHKGWNGSGWTNWQSLGGSFSSNPSAACRPTTTTVDLFARGSDYGLWHETTTGA